MTKSDYKQPRYTGWYDQADLGRKLTEFDNVHPDTGEVLPSMTKQAFKDECDINNILREYKQSGMVTHINAQAAQGRYEDLPDPFDYQDAQNLIIQAQTAFASLPSKIRERFHNDPRAFLEFVENPANADELVTLGLAKAPPPPRSPRRLPNRKRYRSRQKRRGGAGGMGGVSPRRGPLGPISSGRRGGIPLVPAAP